MVDNLRVADHRTYFVGDDTWSFAAWAHNQYHMHHPAFKYVLTPVILYIDRVPLSPERQRLVEKQNLVQLDSATHYNLHNIFDAMDGGAYARRHGWWNIYTKLVHEDVTPARLFDKMADASRQALTNKPQKLQECLNELNRIRDILGIR